MSKIISIRQAQPITNLVEEIRGHLYDAQGAQTKFDKHRLAAGQKLLALRQRIEAGEAGEGVKWWEYYETQFTRSRRDAERLMKMAGADNPEEAAEQEKAKAREGMSRHRATNVSRSIESGDDDYDLVDHALRLVDKMDGDQRERFDAAYMEEYHER